MITHHFHTQPRMRRLLTKHLIKQACTRPCKTSQSDVQIIASEPDGQVSKSDVQQVALYTHKSGGSQLVVPRKPFPMTNKSLEKFMLWLDWTRTFNKYGCNVAVQGIAVVQPVCCLHCCCFTHGCTICPVQSNNVKKPIHGQCRVLLGRVACCMSASCCKLRLCTSLLSHAHARRQGGRGCTCGLHVTNDCM